MQASALIRLLREGARAAGVDTAAALDAPGLLYGAIVRERRDGTRSRLDVEVRALPGGGGSAIRVSEVEPRRLPRFCPERHINLDGSFCLGWTPRGTSAVPTSVEEATDWWATLRGFAQLQDVADELRRWPSRYAWPHGDAAAYQHARELVLERLPPAVAALESRVRLAGERADRLERRRRPCPCDAGSRIKGCHERDLVRLLVLARERDRAEAAYWQSIAGETCCGTMDGCRLRREPAVPRRKAWVR